jgi:hypothetical protein
MENKSPEEIVDELANNIISMNENGLVDEATIDEINELMTKIYSKENKSLNRDNGEVDPNDEEYCPTNSAYLLLPYAEDPFQFSEDYKNVINLMIRRSGFIDNYDETVKEIIQMRSA